MARTRPRKAKPGELFEYKTIDTSRAGLGWAGFNATLRDRARIGQMMLDGGVADGRRIVSAG